MNSLALIMSEQLPPLVSHESLRVITAAAQVGGVESEKNASINALWLLDEDDPRTEKYT